MSYVSFTKPHPVTAEVFHCLTLQKSKEKNKGISLNAGLGLVVDLDLSELLY